MKRNLCILRNNSPHGSNPANAELTAITLSNIREYAFLHGYDLRVICEPWETAKWNTAFLRAALADYDHVWAVGSDVIITNGQRRLESFLQDGKCVVFGAERLVPETPLNLDTALWTAGAQVGLLLDAWDRLRPEFIGHPHFDQAAMIHLYRTGYPGIGIAPPRAMQSHPVANVETAWQRGDFAMHLIMCGDSAAKHRKAVELLHENRFAMRQWVPPLKLTVPAGAIATGEDRIEESLGDTEGGVVCGVYPTAITVGLTRSGNDLILTWTNPTGTSTVTITASDSGGGFYEGAATSPYTASGEALLAPCSFVLQALDASGNVLGWGTGVYTVGSAGAACLILDLVGGDDE